MTGIRALGSVPSFQCLDSYRTTVMSEERENSSGRTSTLLKYGVSIIMIEIIIGLGLIKVFFFSLPVALPYC